MHHVRSLALAGASLITLATPAGAQQPAPQPSQPAPADQATNIADSEEIVVTARRRQESVQDVPQVVNAVTSESIEKLNLRKFEDIANVVPGLQMRPNANGIGSVTTIRGVNFDVNQSGNNGTVQFYFNEAPLSSNILFSAMTDVEQVTVERGPQGTLRGRSTPSGSINVIMRRPNMTEIGGYLAGTINDIDGQNLNGALNIPIINDRLAVRGAFVISDDEGNRVRPVTGAEADLQNRGRTGRLTVRTTPFGDNRVILQYTYQAVDRRATFYSGVESFNQFSMTSATPPSPFTIDAKNLLAPEGIPARNHQHFTISNFNGELNFFGQKLSYIRLKLKQHFESVGPSDNAGVFGPNQFAPSFAFDSTPPITVVPLGVRPFAQPTDTRSSDTSQEFRLQNNERVVGIFDYVVGFLKYKGGSDTAFDQVIGAFAGPGTTVPLALTEMRHLPLQRFARFNERSFFGNLTAHIGDSTEISGGARRIKYSADSGLNAFDATLNAFVENPSVRVLLDTKATVWAASIKHNFTRDLMAYLSYGTSWRPNTVVIGGPAVPTAFQAEFLRTPPEKSKNIEAGFKSTWLDRRLTFNFTAYRQKYSNYPYRTGAVFYWNQTIPPIGRIDSTAFVTAADVKVKGFEAELSVRPVENWSIGAILSYADGKLSNAVVPCLDLNDDNVPDVTVGTPAVATFLANAPGGLDTCIRNDRSNNASPWGATLQSEYTHPFSESMAGFVRGLFTWKGNSLNDPGNAFDDISSYGILNLYAGVRARDGSWELTAYAKNVLDTFRVLTRSNGPLRTGTLNRGGLTFTNYFGITTTEPREFGITARVAFGSR
jgi:iron complex outermembrane receptor protein